MATTSSKDKEPLPLSDLLRDLALIRASDTELSEILRATSASSESDNKDNVVDQSYTFVKEARAALRIQYRGDLDRVGNTLDHVREGLEEVLEGIDSK
ncbi:hypothetical protein M422DRAFT_39599 [Sphaerobolus stellatus SS14]|uniref:Uncharacterized protein n=1 Tax=Sphaerobolus stellatus (strain SS14) TaxID=990650 RepID=A0A0C9TNM3_SPHS4|nr:hypothetical protein M422DRAFT_39599 [Sphaerobolus stellatus SS14]